MNKTHGGAVQPDAAPETLSSRSVARRSSAVRTWMLAQLSEDPASHVGPHGRAAHEQRAPWWRVMCLSGVDYFSTLGYQPAIAALAAGLLSPLATLVLVLVTLFGALPVYLWVARESPHGAGSIAMLARLVPQWGGKLMVLVLLGFAATDFMITLTLSAADASAHIIENPMAPASMRGEAVPLTLVLVTLLGVVFLRGFREAIRVATLLVGAFLLVNIVVIAVALGRVFGEPTVVTNWWHALTEQHGNPLFMVAIALIIFPKLALGLSGFETGVAVMPQIRAADERDIAGRVAGARKLLVTSALTMSVLLITSSFVTVTLIPSVEFQSGGAANGRALAYLAHEYLGPVFGTVYDVITVAILWFAGASAMAGLLNIVPRYLPRLGMAPAWARAPRPLVLVFTVIAVTITIAFQASVDAQGAAYATGVLVLITSAAIAVSFSALRARRRTALTYFSAVSLVLLYTTGANIVERPDGVKIASIFIVLILAVSLLSRVLRSTELRATSIDYDEQAMRWITRHAGESIDVIAHEPHRHHRYPIKLAHTQHAHRVTLHDPLFVEVTVPDSSEFEGGVFVRGVQRGSYRVLEIDASSVPNALAALVLDLRDRTGVSPQLFFRWTEGNPVANLIKFVLFGEGEIALMTREVLREAEPDPSRRPWVHVA